jgi:hypothetical protein
MSTVALDHACQTGRHSNAERGFDLYETPPLAVEALMRVEKLPRVIWEPACGPGSIVAVLRKAGHIIHASDLIDYGCPDSKALVNFLLERQAPAGVEAVITNPPYRLAERFIAHALDLTPRVAMLLRLAFLEGRRSTGILDGRGLARVHVFKKRLPMMHRAGWTGRKASSALTFAWFVWDRDHHGPAEVDRI